MNKPIGHEPWRYSPLYSYSEAAQLARLSKPTIKRWLYGYETGSSEMPSVFGTADPHARMVSFLQLAEIIVAGSFRQRRIKLEAIRRAHGQAQRETGLEFPFATLPFESMGGHILRIYDLEHGTNFTDPARTSFEALDARGAWTLPRIVVETMRSFDYERNVAARWYPLREQTKLIVVDPRFSAGVPTIAGRRVTIENVMKRFRAEQSIRMIARDLKLAIRDIETVIRYADQIKLKPAA